MPTCHTLIKDKFITPAKALALATFAECRWTEVLQSCAVSDHEYRIGDRWYAVLESWEALDRKTEMIEEAEAAYCAEHPGSISGDWNQRAYDQSCAYWIADDRKEHESGEYLIYRVG